MTTMLDSKSFYLSLFLIAVLISFSGCENSAAPKTEQTKIDLPDARKTETSERDASRKFHFVYGATLTELEPKTKARVWIPVATSNAHQEVKVLNIELPAKHQETKEQKFGNKVYYFEATANEKGEIPIKVSYLVTRKEISSKNYESAKKEENDKYLKESTLVPIDDKLRKDLLGDEKPEGSDWEVARKLYDGVEAHMKYDKPSDKTGWGNGDANWACANGFGNCTDFHSLFISSARNLEIPARFEIGFPLPTDKKDGAVGGYHCWAKFLAKGRWVPVDISEADKNPKMKEYYFGNLTSDRVVFSVGRDLQLLPKPAAESVNYLAYPYAEVDGKQHKKFRKEFSFADLKKDEETEEQ